MFSYANLSIKSVVPSVPSVLTVPAGQEFHFSISFLKFQQIFLIFPQTFLIFFLILARLAQPERSWLRHWVPCMSPLSHISVHFVFVFIKKFKLQCFRKTKNQNKIKTKMKNNNNNNKKHGKLTKLESF